MSETRQRRTLRMEVQESLSWMRRQPSSFGWAEWPLAAPSACTSSGSGVRLRNPLKGSARASTFPCSWHSASRGTNRISARSNPPDTCGPRISGRFSYRIQRFHCSDAGSPAPVSVEAVPVAALGVGADGSSLRSAPLSSRPAVWASPGSPLPTHSWTTSCPRLANERAQPPSPRQPDINRGRPASNSGNHREAAARSAWHVAHGQIARRKSNA